MKKNALAFAVALGLVGCVSQPTGQVIAVYTNDVARECDHLFGTFGNFLDAEGCYRIVRGVCKIMVKEGEHRQEIEEHELRHCREGDFHHDEVVSGR